MTIKINFVGFWNSFNPTDNFFYNILSKHFDIEISENPDFVICSNRGNPFEYMKYDCVRIMYMGENMSPDFTVFDYVLGFDYLEFGDRYFHIPVAFYNESGKPSIFPAISEEDAKKILAQKKYFCNFIYHHPSAHGVREELFRCLNEYKPVISPGDYLNNMVLNENKSGCTWKQKREIVTQSKFTIACDSISYPGFVTEKIVDPFRCHSVPIYFGNPLVERDFNTQSFVWCKSENDIEETVERVTELDRNDNAYIEMLTKQPLNNPEITNKLYAEAETFLVNIFSQPPENAKRRIKFFAAEKHELYLKKCMLSHEKDNSIGFKESLYNLKKKLLK